MTSIKKIIITNLLIGLLVPTVAISAQEDSEKEEVQETQEHVYNEQATKALLNAIHCVDVHTALDQGADINAVRVIDDWLNGFTPLLIALKLGRLDIAHLLIERNADVNKPHLLNGETPLMLASQAGYFEIVQHVLSRGADVNAIESIGGESVLHKAVRCANNSRVIEALLHAGAVVDVLPRDGNGCSPLAVLAQYGHERDISAEVRILMLAGADPDLVMGLYGFTPKQLMRDHVDLLRVMGQVPEEMLLAQGLSTMLAETDVLKQCLQEAGIVDIVDDYAALPFAPKKVKAKKGTSNQACCVPVQAGKEGECLVLAKKAALCGVMPAGFETQSAQPVERVEDVRAVDVRAVSVNSQDQVCDYWVCPQCTLMNDKAAMNCIACGADRPAHYANEPGFFD